MATWFTADLHLGHRNIIDYCDRPFTDVDVMNRALVDNWNEVVAELVDAGPTSRQVHDRHLPVR